MNKKISTPLAISIIVILAILVGGGIIFYNYYACSNGYGTFCPTKPTSKSEKNQYWKTYNNEKGGYTIEYPPDFVAVDGGMYVEENLEATIFNITNFFKNYQNNSEEEGWKIFVWKNSGKLSAQQFADNTKYEEYEDKNITFKNKEISDINIDGVEGKKVIYDSVYSLEGQEVTTNATVIYVTKGGNMYEFAMVNKRTYRGGILDGDVITFKDSNFNQAISTFKFTK